MGYDGAVTRAPLAWLASWATLVVAANVSAQTPAASDNPPTAAEAPTKATEPPAKKGAGKPAVPATASPASPAATKGSDVESTYTQALNAFKYQDFDTAIPLFRKVLANPENLGRKRLWRAREFLGAALWFNGDKQGANDQFTGLLLKNPQARLDPAYYPPQMIADFVRVRRKLIALGAIKPEEKPLPPSTPTKYEPPPAMLSYVPFGVGQIANREIGKGIAFMVAESALAATSVYFYQRNARLGAKSVQYSSGEAAGQLIPGIGFYMLAAWGIVDAVLTRKDSALPRAGTLPTAR